MFRRNDYALRIARILLIIFVCVGAVLSVVFGILYSIEIHWTYIFIIFAGWLGCFVFWIIIRLILSFFCDVKLIRNKLYEEDNEYLEVFFKS